MKSGKLFQRRILYLLIIVFIIPFIFVYFALISNRYNSAKNQRQTVNALFLGNEAAYVEKLLYLATLSINDISRNTVITNYLSSESMPVIDDTIDIYRIFRSAYIAEYSNSFSKLGGYVDRNTLVSINIYSSNENLVFSDFLKPYDELDTNLKKATENNKEILLKTDDKNNIFILKSIHFSKFESLAVIVLTFSSDIFTREYNAELNDYGNLIFEINGNTYNLNSAHPFKGKTIESTATVAVPGYSWINGTMTYIFPADRITKSILSDVFIISVSFAFLLIVLVIAFYHTSKYLTNRLYFLIEDINNEITVENIGAAKNKNDEFDIIRNKILDMMQIINKKEKELFANEIEKKNIETRLLQELFNPHFLYNTLACLKYKFKGNKTIENTVDEMVNYYRVALNKGSIEITLENELLMIESYVHLQNFAYERSIDLKININKSLRDQRIIKMLLQSLVENAFFHAFPDPADNCVITVDVKDSGENIIIIVTDNGVGMGQINTQELLESGGNADEFGIQHYGLYNTNMKIKTFYGDEYGICISSAPGEGTQVKIEIPMKY